MATGWSPARAESLRGSCPVATSHAWRAERPASASAVPRSGMSIAVKSASLATTGLRSLDLLAAPIPGPVAGT